MERNMRGTRRDGRGRSVAQWQPPHGQSRAPRASELRKNPELAQRGLKRFAAFKDMLDTHLEGRDYIAVSSFSFADISAYVFCDFARVIKMRVTDEHPHLKAWFDRVSERPSASA